FGHRDRDVLLAVVHTKGQADKLRQDGGTTRPDFDDIRLAGFPGFLGLAKHIGIDKGALPNRTCHGLTPLLRVTRPQNVFVGRFVRAGPGPLGALAPGGNRVTTTRGPALTTTMRVVDRVHGDTAHTRTDALVTVAASFTKVLVRVVRVRHGADGRHAFLTHHAQFARGQADLGIATVAADELGVGAGRTGQLAALAGLQLDVVNDGTDRHTAERHGVAGLDVHFIAGDDLVAHSQTLRSDDVGLLTVFIFDQRDEGGTVGVVFDPLDGRRNIKFSAPEIDDAIETLRP